MSHRFKPADTPQKSRRKHIILSVVLFAFAALLTTYGFFGEGAPLALAYLPFIGALITLRREYRAALCGAHFGVVAVIAGWGLISLGHSPLWVVPAAMLVVAGLSLGYSVLGAGLASVILLGVPYMPGNPLLMAGSITPGLGLFGLIGVAILACALPFWRSPRTRALVLLVGFGGPASIGAWVLTPDEENQASAASALAGFTEVALVDTTPGDRAWALRLAMADLAPGSTVITGENVLLESNTLELRGLCRFAQIRELKVLLGVQGRDGRATVRLIDGHSCEALPTLYVARIGIPGLTGPSGLKVAEAIRVTRLTEVAPEGLGFLACFEAFSLHRWLAVSRSGVNSVAVLSNDIWTTPLKVALLRQKVSAELGRLFGLSVAHSNADVGGPILVREGGAND